MLDKSEGLILVVMALFNQLQHTIVLGVNEMLFTSTQGKRQAGNVVSTFNVNADGECAVYCFDDERCYSFNVVEQADPSNPSQCQVIQASEKLPLTDDPTAKFYGEYSKLISQDVTITIII